ncbi:DUF6602 domain-containing protein [Haloferula sargassicola]
MLRENYPPLTKKADGKYEGDILAFVKGLRIAALLTYCLRDWVSGSHWEASWGHVIDSNGKSCSPECDIIIHKGHVAHWNGDGGKNPMMDFKFVDASSVLAVVSCKSRVASVDDDYPGQLAKYGVRKVLLFGECCSQSNYENLVSKAKAAGYQGLWCAYFQNGSGEGMATDESVYANFYETVKALLGSGHVRANEPAAI